MHTSSLFRLLSLCLVVFLQINLPVKAQAQPCTSNPQTSAGICPGDLLTLSPVNCPTCVYSWSGSPLNGNTSQSAQYFFPPPSGYPNTISWSQVSMSYSDPMGSCTGTGLYVWEVGAFGPEQMSTPTLVNGPYNGDTSVVWIYRRERNPIIAGVGNWDYWRTYSVTGGTLIASYEDYIGNPFLIYEDTLWIKWDKVPNHGNQSSGQLTVTQANLAVANCSNYSESLSLPIPNAYPVGDSAVCTGDTAVYYTTPIPTATYNWTTTGGNIISGQGTDQVEVVWTNPPGDITISRVLNSVTSTNTLAVSTAPLPSLSLGNDTTICWGDTLVLDAGPSPSYLWSTGAVGQTINVPDSGTVWASIQMPYCGSLVNVADTILVDTILAIKPYLGNDTTICPTATLLLDPGVGFVSYMWSNNASSPTITLQGIHAGTYSIATQDINNCVSTDTLVLSAFSVVDPDLGPDTTVCPGEMVVFDAGPGYSSYTWSNATTTQTTSASFPAQYFVEVDDLNGCQGRDTVLLINHPFLPPPLGNDTILCADTSIVLDAGPGLSNILWSTGAITQTITVTTGMQYHVDATDGNGCSLTDTVDITGLGDCVFPGDCDYDGLADNNDLLAIGVAFGQNGPPRANASLQWYGQQATDFGANLPSGPNVKHCDSNGDGVVNNNDTLAISMNYGFSHNKADLQQATGPVLLIQAAFDSVMAGDTAIYRVFLGDSLSPADSVYGLAFTVNYDTTLVDTQGLFFADYSNCWMAPASQLLTLTQDLYPVPRADLAVVRTNSNDTTGYGEICRLGFVTIDNISGKKELLTKVLEVSLSNIRFINHEMMSLAITGSSDSAVVYQEELGIAPAVSNSDLRIFPVPARDEIIFHLKDRKIMGWKMYSLEGKVVLSGENISKSRCRVETAHLAGGMYLLELVDASGGKYIRKIPILE